jgi:hypothetical protein
MNVALTQKDKIIIRGKAQKRVSLSGKVCCVCGADGTTERGQLERHHDNYDKNNPAAVVILCQMCHFEAHGKKPQEARPCVICGKLFINHKFSVKTCGSEHCQEVARSRSRSLVWAIKREIPKPHNAVCPICGKSFYRPYPQRKTCGDPGCTRELKRRSSKVRHERERAG